MAVVVKVAFISVKHTSDTYLQQRAELFMQSVTENALLAIEGYNRKENNNCLANMHFVDENKKFEANVTVLRYYCYDTDDCPCGSLTKKIKTDKSNGYVLLKIVVEGNETLLDGKKIRLSQVTLQRP
jgi:hypothetical protein